MKPNFALNLSHEGISLLHRAKAGWLPVGDVSLSDPDLDDRLHMLRKTAADLSSGGLTTKLVIPNSQVLYTDIETKGPDTAARISEIRDGLVGLTPYDVSDLVFDWRLMGNTAQVAVVARETLQEAENFASEFRFNPICFVAMPTNGSFRGEPYFGPSQLAADLLAGGETIEPDDDRLEVISAGQTPARKPAPDPVLEPVVEPTPVAPKPETPAAPEPVEPEPKVEPEAEEPMPVFVARRRGSDAMEVAPEPKPEPAAKESEPAAPAFASRRASAPVVAAEPTPKVAVSKPKPAAKPKAPVVKKPTPETAPTVPIAASALDIDDVPDMPNWRELGPAHTPDARDLPIPDLPPSAGVTAAHSADLPAPEPIARASGAKAKAAGAAVAGTIGRLGKGSAASFKRRRQAPDPNPTAAKEAEALTVFGARGKPKVGGKPRYLGFILILLLLLAFAVLALWSTYFLSDEARDVTIENGTIPLVAAVDPTTTLPDLTEVPLEPVPENTETTTPDPIDTAITEALEGTQTSLETPEPVEELALLTDPTSEPPPDRISQPPPTLAEAEARYASTGIWQLDPAPPPQTPGGDKLEDLYVASIDPVIQSQDAVALPDARRQLNDQRVLTLSPPPSLGTSFDLDGRGLVRATPDGAISPEGIQVFAGQPPVVPRLRPGSGTPDAPIEEVPAQPTEEATETPVEETPAPNTIELTPEEERLQEIRPPARPDTALLQENNERLLLGGFSRTELAAIRPPIRPQSLQEEIATRAAIEAAVAEADSASTLEAEEISDLAIEASLAPRNRPSGFAALVAKAREAAKTNPPDTETTVAAARIPSIPTRTSVADTATDRNAINLSKVNLIGVYGSPADRRALVRLRSGRFIKVEVGDRVDGGRVAAIGDDELRYVKSGRNITLKLPRG